MSQAATVCPHTLSSGKEKEDGQQKSQQVEHKNSGDSWFKLLGVQDTAGHERKPALFQQGRGEELIITLQAFTEESAGDGSIWKQRAMCTN